MIHRVMARCGTCTAWWSVGEDDREFACPCGGKLVHVDTKAHARGLSDNTEAAQRQAGTAAPSKPDKK